MTRILTRADLESLLDPPAVIAALRAAFAALGAGQAQVPQRMGLELPTGGTFFYMPGFLDAPPAPVLGTKVVAIQPDNPAHGLPRIQAVCLLHDPVTGDLRAVLDATFLTEIRTACTSALVTDYLALPDAATLLVFGTGPQARAHLAAIAAVRPLRAAWVVGHTPEKAAAFVAAHGARFAFPLTAIAGPDAIRAALAGAAIVVTCTNAAEPLFDGVWLQPGTHINAVGSYRPATREVDTATIARARVLVDTRAGALSEAGDLLIPLAEGAITPDHIRAELADLVLARAVLRESPGDITLFKSVGFALEDAATAALACARAEECGVGVEVAF
jgi:ornithine cyclodeaminase